MMLTLEQVREELQKLTLLTVAQDTQLAYDTIWRISHGKDKSVSYRVVKILSDYVKFQEQQEGK